MRLLLDTHALLWWWGGDTRLPPKIREMIESGTSEILVSAASAWEIATKVRIGKLPTAKPLIERFEELLSEQGFRHLAITLAHGHCAGSLKSDHRDPFDRILAAQSMIEDLPLVSADARIERLGARLFW